MKKIGKKTWGFIATIVAALVLIVGLFVFNQYRESHAYDFELVASGKVRNGQPNTKTSSDMPGFVSSTLNHKKGLLKFYNIYNDDDGHTLATYEQYEVVSKHGKTRMVYDNKETYVAFKNYSDAKQFKNPVYVHKDSAKKKNKPTDFITVKGNSIATKDNKGYGWLFKKRGPIAKFQTMEGLYSLALSKGANRVSDDKIVNYTVGLEDYSY